MSRAASLLAAAVLLACEPSDGEGPGGTTHSRGSAEVGGEVVATVDGYPITRAEVGAAARAAGVPPRVALSRLTDELLLALAAERRGLGPSAAVERAARQARVQLLLRNTVEAEPVEISDAEIEAAFAANPNRFQAPERRLSAHVLARVVDAAHEADARRFIEEIHAELRAADDPVATALSIRRRPLDALPFEVVVQEVDGLAADADTDRAYVDALFAAPAEGVLAAPVRTSMGWHAIVLTHIEPERATPRDEALATLRAEREAVLRNGALVRLIAELARDRPVFLAPNVAELLSIPLASEPAP